MAQYKTGTVSVTNGSAVVNGSGTQWLSNVSPGDSFTVVGSGVTYDVAAVDSDSQLQLTVPYAGEVAAGLAYVISRDFTPHGIPEMNQGDIETASIFTRAMRKVDDMVKTVPILTDEARQAAEAASTKASEAATSASNAASSASSASSSKSAAATSATNAANSASSATSSKNAAATSASNAASSASAALGSQTAAKTSETNAASSASSANSSKTAAASSASAAKTSETNAASSASAASSSEAAAASSATTASNAATTATQKAGEAQNFRDQAAEIAGLDTVEQAIDVALPTAPALLDGLRRSVEAASGGRMTVIYTAKGQPSYFVRQPKFLCEDIAPGGELGSGTHEAFVFDGAEDSEIWIGAYQASIVNGEAVSQPGVAPGVSVSYDQARAYCQAAGAGFDLMTVWDWAAIALWCMPHGFEPRGNTNHGRHHDNRWETGTRQDGGVVGDSGGVGNILTGSGPAEWRHDGTMSGISDLVGNVWEWLSGMKMLDGRVYLSADNAIPSESGYADTAFNMPSSRTWATIDNTGADVALKRALLVPKGVDDPAGYLSTALTGEPLPLRGGTRSNGANTGLGALSLNAARTYSGSSVGFRPRFRNP